jgi:hypothetical protein
MNNLSRTERKKLKTAEKCLRKWYLDIDGHPNAQPPWRIERDPNTISPYIVYYIGCGRSYKKLIRDLEKINIDIIKEICGRHDIFYYINLILPQKIVLRNRLHIVRIF